MPRIRNISPLGDLYVPSLNVTVPSGAVLALDDDQQDTADALLRQQNTWAEVVSRTAPTEPAPAEPAPAEPAAEVAGEPEQTDPEQAPVEDPTPVEADTPPDHAADEPTTDDGSAPAEPTA